MPAFPPLLRSAAESALGTPLAEITPLSGGDANEVYRLGTARGEFVLKVGHETTDHPRMFHAEAQGLDLLRSAGALMVPEVLGYGLERSPGGSGLAWLLLPYLTPAPETPAAQEAFGRGLAALHRVTSPTFGGTPGNFMGRQPQPNPARDSAAAFFRDARLLPQLERAQLERAQWLSAGDRADFGALLARLPNLIPPEPPALVHGDLWRGNAIFTVHGPALIDPAAAYSHREVDLALMRLFGGFSERVFAAYEEAFPTAPGAAARADLWNLYPLLMHVNSFGARYLGRLRTALGEALTL